MRIIALSASIALSVAIAVFVVSNIVSTPEAKQLLKKAQPPEEVAAVQRAPVPKKAPKNALDKKAAQAAPDESIELEAEPFEMNNGRYIYNGSVFDRAELPIAEGQPVVLPKAAHVLRDGKEGQLDIFMKKTLRYHGHGESMHARDSRTSLGCVTRIEGRKLVLATYGEWDSNIEGGEFMALVVRAPKNLHIETRAGLSGPKMMAPHRARRPDRKQPVPGTDGWKDLPSVPDPERTAKKLAPPEPKR